MIHTEELNFIKSRLTFWNQLTQQQADFLLSGLHPAHFHKGQSLHRGETDCIGILLVKSGILRVYITSDEGREVTLYRLTNGDICILSASCILKSIHFDVSIDAETDCDILQIHSSAFSRLASENVYAELFSYKLATERFSDVMWAMQEILFTSFDKRLAAFLLDESLKAGSSTIPMTHEQIAKYLGSAREVVSRMLKYFSNEGLVSLSRGSVTILNIQKLRTLVSVPASK